MFEDDNDINKATLAIIYFVFGFPLDDKVMHSVTLHFIDELFGEGGDKCEDYEDINDKTNDACSDCKYCGKGFGSRAKLMPPKDPIATVT